MTIYYECEECGHGFDIEVEPAKRAVLRTYLVESEPPQQARIEGPVVCPTCAEPIYEDLVLELARECE
jgi:formylmethanofuran dehydrogenase subunit E